MYNENNRGPRTDPCGTPYFTGDNWYDSPHKFGYAETFTFVSLVNTTCVNGWAGLNRQLCRIGGRGKTGSDIKSLGGAKHAAM